MKKEGQKSANFTAECGKKMLQCAEIVNAVLEESGAQPSGSPLAETLHKRLCASVRAFVTVEMNCYAECCGQSIRKGSTGHSG